MRLLDTHVGLVASAVQRNVFLAHKLLYISLSLCNKEAG